MPCGNLFFFFLKFIVDIVSHEACGELRSKFRNFQLMWAFFFFHFREIQIADKKGTIWTKYSQIFHPSVFQSSCSSLYMWVQKKVMQAEKVMPSNVFQDFCQINKFPPNPYLFFWTKCARPVFGTHMLHKVSILISLWLWKCFLQKMFHSFNEFRMLLF